MDWGGTIDALPPFVAMLAAIAACHVVPQYLADHAEDRLEKTSANLLEVNDSTVDDPAPDAPFLLLAIATSIGFQSTGWRCRRILPIPSTSVMGNQAS